MTEGLGQRKEGRWFSQKGLQALRKTDKKNQQNLNLQLTASTKERPRETPSPTPHPLTHTPPQLYIDFKDNCRSQPQ